MINLQNLKVDFGDGGPDDEISLTQEFGGNEHMVTLHPSQMRLIADRMGLTAAADARARRTITALARQLRVLFDRIGTLDDWLNQVASNGHEDLSVEVAFSLATWEIAREFVLALPAADEAVPALDDDGAPPAMRVASASAGSPEQHELPLCAAAVHPMANGCATDGNPMANAIPPRGVNP